MAYKFGFPGGETLDHNQTFKSELDSLFSSSKNVTFVGWRQDTGLDVFINFFNNFQYINVVEIFKPNADLLASFKIPKLNVLNFDIRDHEDFLKSDDLDCLVWQDGPEHLEMQESKNILNELKTKFKKIIIATPKGEYIQGPLYGNESERHLSSWEIQDYQNLGFEVSIIGEIFLIGYWKNEKI